MLIFGGVLENGVFELVSVIKFFMVVFVLVLVCDGWLDWNVFFVVFGGLLCCLFCVLMFYVLVIYMVGLFL